ncbi:MAG: ElyC/SanA/YdcF family protein [Candidatus Acidiferrum sp.]
MRDRRRCFLPRLRGWLSPADIPRGADLIFVLAGRVDRKDYALELFRQGLSPRILFSVGGFEIRRFSQMPLPVPLDLLKLAQETPPPQRHYFAFFQRQNVQLELVLPGRFGTLREIEALAGWLRAHPDIRSVSVISSETHLRRIRMCCRSLLNPNLELAYLAAPFTPPEPELRFALANTMDLLLELFKVSIYWALLKIR